MLRFEGAPLETASVAVIAVHGRDQDPNYMAEHLVEPVVAELAATVPDGGDRSVAWLLPGSPERSWYPGRFADPVSTNQPHLDRALGRLDEVVEQVAAAGVDRERIVWVGFSQGGCLVLEYALRNPGPWGGFAILTGAMLGGAQPIDGDHTGTRFHFGVGDADPWMPAEQAWAAAHVLEGAGALTSVEVAVSDVHEIRPQEVTAVAAMIVAADERSRHDDNR